MNRQFVCQLLFTQHTEREWGDREITTCISFAALSPSNFSGLTQQYIIKSRNLFSVDPSWRVKKMMYPTILMINIAESRSRVLPEAFRYYLVRSQISDNFLGSCIAKYKILLQLSKVPKIQFSDKVIEFTGNLMEKRITRSVFISFF